MKDGNSFIHTNLFLKSAMRQPLRSLLMAMLIAASTFTFVARAAEYIAVSDRMDDIAGFYRAIGVLHPSGGHEADVSAGADTERFASRFTRGTTDG